MGFHVETSEMKTALEHYQKLSKTAQEQLDHAKKSLNGIINSNAMQGQVGQSIAADINNNKNAVLVGLKDGYKLVESDLQRTYVDFLETTGETSENAILNEAFLIKEKNTIDQFITEHKEKRQIIKSTYSEIADLIALSMPSSSPFTNACNESKKQLDKIVQKVNEFESKQQESSSSNIIDVLAQQIKTSEEASGLSYTDPAFMEFVSRTELAEAIKDIDEQITEAEKQAKLKAEEEAKRKQEEWADQHPVESFLKDVSDSIGNWWGNVVEGTKNLSIPEDTKAKLLFLEGFIGAAGSTVSSIAIGAVELVHLVIELGEWGIDSIRGVETPQWKLDDINGAWENTKAIVTTVGTVMLGVTALTFPNLALISPLSREALKRTIEMGRGILDKVLTDIVTGDFYAIGGYTFDIASLFVGVGEVSAALKGTKIFGKLAEGATAFKAASKIKTLGKLGKVKKIVSKSLKYGDEAAKAFGKKLMDIPLPIMETRQLAGIGNFKFFGKGTLGDYMKAAKAKFSRGGGFIDDAAKKASGAGRKLSIDDLTKELLETKPLNSRDPKKWLSKGGEIEILEDGTWVYTNASGQSVKYTNGFPDFKEAGFVQQEVNIEEFTNYANDFKKADKLAPNGPRDAANNTWHHHQDLKTLQEVDKGIHKEFTHQGGMALKKRK